MLEQMAKFELRNAKCSVEADRPLVEEQVGGLGRFRVRWWKNSWGV